MIKPIPQFENSTWPSAGACRQGYFTEQPSALNRGPLDYLIDLTTRFERLDY